MSNDMVTHKQPEKALQNLKNGKAVEADGIIAEVIQAGGRLMKDIILKTFNPNSIKRKNP